jgi:hypothetical protein
MGNYGSVPFWSQFPKTVEQLPKTEEQPPKTEEYFNKMIRDGNSLISEGNSGLCDIEDNKMSKARSVVENRIPDVLTTRVKTILGNLEADIYLRTKSADEQHEIFSVSGYGDARWSRAIIDAGRYNFECRRFSEFVNTISKQKHGDLFDIGYNHTRLACIVTAKISDEYQSPVTQIYDTTDILNLERN